MEEEITVIMDNLLKLHREKNEGYGETATHVGRAWCLPDWVQQGMRIEEKLCRIKNMYGNDAGPNQIREEFMDIALLAAIAVKNLDN